MGILEAIQVLGLHSWSIENHADPRYTEGFLGSLRPYQGELKEENFHEVIDCLLSLKDFVQQPSEGSLAAAREVHRMLDRGRAWISDRDGMLERNEMVSDEDREHMESWLDVISETWMHILDGADEETIRGVYEGYVREDR